MSGTKGPSNNQPLVAARHLNVARFREDFADSRGDFASEPDYERMLRVGERERSL